MTASATRGAHGAKGRGTVHVEYLGEFLILAETMNFSAAARRIHVAQSTLSKHIAALEHNLDAQLFVRGDGQLRLTREGEAFRRDAAAIVGQYDKARARIQSIKGCAHRPIYLGYFYEAGTMFLAPLRRWFEKSYPKTALKAHSLDIDELLTGLFSKELDAIVAPDANESVREGIESRRLYGGPLLVAVSWANPLSSLETVTPEKLFRERLLVPNPDKWPIIRRYVDARFAGTPALSNSIVSEESNTMFNLVETNVGVAIVAGYNTYAHSRDVRFIPLDDPAQPRLDVCLIWEAGQKRDPEAKASLDVLLRAFDAVLPKIGDLPGSLA